MLSVQIIKCKNFIVSLLESRIQIGKYSPQSSICSVPLHPLDGGCREGHFPGNVLLGTSPGNLSWAPLPATPCVTQLMQSVAENGSTCFLFLALYFQCSNEPKKLQVLGFSVLFYCVLVVKSLWVNFCLLKDLLYFLFMESWENFGSFLVTFELSGEVFTWFYLVV